jgi:hypothetical protein
MSNPSPSQIRKSNIANKPLISFRFAKNALSSPSNPLPKTTPTPHIRYIDKKALAMEQALDAASRQSELTPTTTRGKLAFTLLILAITSFALLYAVTRAFVWDEGYHLIAAQEISRGHLPYLDFCFPQTPLNAFFNAAILKLFGQHWRPVHVGATLFSMGSMLLAAQYILTRFPAPQWRLPLALTAAIFVGLNEVVIQFGTIGQAYGICLFFTMAAYRVALATPARVSLLHPLICGLLAGIAPGSSLLSAPVLPVLLVWIWRYDRVGLPWRKALAFIAGIVIAFLPVVWLFLKSPDQTFFNVLQYHTLYRSLDWPTPMAVHHNLLVFTSLVDSTQALTLCLLGIAGVLFIAKQSDWLRHQRGEFYLAAWIAFIEGAYLCTPRPTFSRYFILLTPFLTIVSMAGIYGVASRMGFGQRPKWPASIAAVLMSLMFTSFGVSLFDQTTWQEYEKVAQKVAEVTPKDGRIFADELVYFILQITPPSGMECSYTHVLPLPPAQLRRQHLVTEAELKGQFEHHEFVTAQSCSDPELDRLGVAGAFRYRNDMDDCTVFWGERKK